MPDNPFVKADPAGRKLKILLYGPSGSGKTLAALTFPRPAVIDAESGTDLYAGQPGIGSFHSLHVKTTADALSAVRYIKENKGQTFDTLVIDPISVLYDSRREAFASASKAGDMGYREYGKLNVQMKNFYSQLSDLPVHLVITARLADSYRHEGSELVRVGTKPDADKAILYYVDFIIELAPDHTGIVRKSRGVPLGPQLAAVNWPLFVPIAAGFASGKIPPPPTSASSAAARDDLSDYVIARQFVEAWRAQGLTDGDILAALDVSKISQWTHGRAAADIQIGEWLTRKLDQAKSGGNHQHEESPA